MTTVEKFKKYLAEKTEFGASRSASFATRYAKDAFDALEWGGDSAIFGAAMGRVAADLLAEIEKTESDRAPTGGIVSTEQVERTLTERTLRAAAEPERTGASGLVHHAKLQALAELASEFRMLARFEAEFAVKAAS